MNKIIQDEKSNRMVITHDPRVATEKLIKLTQKIPAYKKIHTEKFNNDNLLETLDRFPILNKVDLIECCDNLFMKQAALSLLCETSGTTGSEPLFTPRSNTELNWNSDNLASAFNYFLDMGDRVALFNPVMMSTYAVACGIALRKVQIPYFHAYPIPHLFDYQKFFRALRSYEVNVVMTTPYLANKLIYEWKIHYADEPFPISKFLLAGEILTSADAQNIERLSGAKAFNFVYGSSESATCMIGCKKQYYHPIGKDFVFELFPSERKGVYQLIISWLRDGVRPLIRYNTGDYFSVKQQCYCEQPDIALKVEGRQLFNEIDRVKLDQLVYSLPISIYFYTIKIKAKQAELTLFSDRDFGNKEKLKKILSDELGELNLSLIKLNVNPKSHDFYAFSPRTKCERIELAN